MAVDSLRSVAGLLSETYSALHDSVFGRTDVPENHTLDTFFSTVKATADVSTVAPFLFISQNVTCHINSWLAPGHSA